MKRISVRAVLLLLGLIGSGAEGADPEVQLGKTFYPSSIRFVTAISEDREAATLIFENFVLGTSSGKGELLEAETKSFTFANEAVAKEGITATFDIRGFASVQDGGSAALMIHVGGETTLVDLDKAMSSGEKKRTIAGEKLYQAAKEQAGVAELTVNSRPKSSSDYSVRVSADFDKGEPVKATVVLLVDRLSPTGSEALIAVDSIDLTVKAAPTPKETTSDSRAESKSESPKKTETVKTSDEKEDEPATQTKAETSKKTSTSKKSASSATADKDDGKPAAEQKETKSSSKSSSSKATSATKEGESKAKKGE